jgi:hypothetical protein
VRPQWPQARRCRSFAAVGWLRPVCTHRSRCLCAQVRTSRPQIAVDMSGAAAPSGQSSSDSAAQHRQELVHRASRSSRGASFVEDPELKGRLQVRRGHMGALLLSLLLLCACAQALCRLSTALLLVYVLSETSPRCASGGSGVLGGGCSLIVLAGVCVGAQAMGRAAAEAMAAARDGRLRAGSMVAGLAPTGSGDSHVVPFHRLFIVAGKPGEPNAVMQVSVTQCRPGLHRPPPTRIVAHMLRVCAAPVGLTVPPRLPCFPPLRVNPLQVLQAYEKQSRYARSKAGARRR